MSEIDRYPVKDMLPFEEDELESDEEEEEVEENDSEREMMSLRKKLIQ